LGYNSALVNAAILALDFNAVSSKDIQYANLNEILKKDDFFNLAVHNNLSLVRYDDPFGYLF
jgi:hypothetical protein